MEAFIMDMEYEMSDEEIWQELVWDKIQTHEYIVVDGKVYDYASGEFICSMSFIK
jgi:hypothetical protein